MRLAFLILCFLLTFQSFSQLFSLHGTVSDRDTGTVVLWYKNYDRNWVSDTAKIINGNFSIYGTVGGLDYALLQNDPNYSLLDETRNAYFLLDTGTIFVQYEFEKAGEASFTGSAINDSKKKWEKSLENFLVPIKTQSKRLDSIRNLLQNEPYQAHEIIDQIKLLTKSINILRDSVKFRDLDYIDKYPRNNLSMYLLRKYRNKMSLDSLKMYYSKIDTSVQNTSFGLDMAEIINDMTVATKKKLLNAFDSIQLNQKAPPFTIYKNDKEVTNENYLGKVLLIENWDLYCIPCLQMNRYLEELREKYEVQGLEIIGVTNTSEMLINKFENYVIKVGISQWNHVFLNERKSSTKGIISGGNFKRYDGTSIPTSILIDKSGKVIYKSEGFSNQHIKDLDLIIGKAIM